MKVRLHHNIKVPKSKGVNRIVKLRPNERAEIIIVLVVIFLLLFGIGKADPERKCFCQFSTCSVEFIIRMQNFTTIALCSYPLAKMEIGEV